MQERADARERMQNQRSAGESGETVMYASDTIPVRLSDVSFQYVERTSRERFRPDGPT